MKFFTIELKITLLILVIVASIIATGYLSYKNLSQIVDSIHNEARPDYKLITIKEITSDLSDADNNVRLYSLTQESKYRESYHKIISKVNTNIDELLTLRGNDSSLLTHIHAIKALTAKRLVVWNQLLELHTNPLEKEIFDEFYTTIEKKTNDSVPEKRNILNRFFKKKKDITLGKEEVSQEVAKLERALTDFYIRQAETESALLKRNNQLGSQLQLLIIQLEQKETESLFIRSLEAEVLAAKTYQWLAVFCVAAVLLLILVLLIIINYSRKSYQTQKYLQQAKMEADNLVKAKELFTANVSHELRTPMNAIYGLSEQILQQSVESKLKDQLLVIKNSADYLNKVVNDILDFSKIQAGKLIIEKIPFNLVQVLQEVCTLNQVIARRKNLEFKCNIHEHVPSQVIGDPTRLRQILLNLLSNAFKFTEKGEVSINVDTYCPTADKVSLIVTVADTGIGISPEKINLIFDDYTQAEESTNRRYGGTGLGLSIVKRLLELMEGTIEVQSVLHEGTRFTFTIPFILDKSDAAVIPEQVIQVPEEFKKLSVLIADDEEYNRMVVSNILQKWGIQFAMAANGADATVMAGGTFYDIVMMDLRMPEMNGYEAAERILKISPNTRIIALTAGTSTDDLIRCREAGITGYLLKPFSEKELRDTLLESVSMNIPEEKETEVKIVHDEIQLGELYRVSGGDEHFVEEMLGLFIKTTHEGIRELRQHLSDKNWQGISETAHKMSSPCRHLGAMGLYANLKELEKTGDSKNYAKIKHLVEVVITQIEILTSKIEQKIA